MRSRFGFRPVSLMCFGRLGSRADFNQPFDDFFDQRITWVNATTSLEQQGLELIRLDVGDEHDSGLTRSSHDICMQLAAEHIRRWPGSGVAMACS